jgi:hypothetical protein
MPPEVFRPSGGPDQDYDYFDRSASRCAIYTVKFHGLEELSVTASWYSCPRCRALCKAAISLLVVLGASGSARAAAPQDLPRLKVLESHTLPLREISGLTPMHQDGNGVDLYAVGDAGFDVGRFRRSASGEIDVRVRNLMPPEASGKSQWEAAAVNGCGNLCVLAESRSQITCFDAELAKTLGRFDLDPSGVKGLAKQWNKKNSLGEGMVLMRGGHLLLLKEKDPSLLVEFGPPGSSAQGWNAGFTLGAGECFVLPPGSTLVARKVWEFSKHLKKLADDASELAVGPDGRLYMLSDKSALLLRLEDRLKPEKDKVKANAVWRLPKGFDKGYAAHCTSFVGFGATCGKRRRFESLRPCFLTGGSSPGCSYRHSFLSL